MVTGWWDGGALLLDAAPDHVLLIDDGPLECTLEGLSDRVSGHGSERGSVAAAVDNPAPDGAPDEEEVTLSAAPLPSDAMFCSDVGPGPGHTETKLRSTLHSFLAGSPCDATDAEELCLSALAVLGKATADEMRASVLLAASRLRCSAARSSEACAAPKRTSVPLAAHRAESCCKHATVSTLPIPT